MVEVETVTTRQMLAERVTALIADHLGVEADAVKPLAHLRDDLGADSLDAIELAMALEEEFGLFVEDVDGRAWKTPNDVVDYVERHLERH